MEGGNKVLRWQEEKSISTHKLKRKKVKKGNHFDQQTPAVN